jgi:hypothetical protein
VVCLLFPGFVSLWYPYYSGIEALEAEDGTIVNGFPFLRGCQSWSNGQGLGPCGEGLRVFEPRPPHIVFFSCVLEHLRNTQSVNWIPSWFPNHVPRILYFFPVCLSICETHNLSTGFPVGSRTTSPALNLTFCLV